MRARTIQLIAPSAYPPDMAVVERGIAHLEAGGHTVLNRACALRKFQRFAGTDAERAQEINDLAYLPDGVDVVLAVRGGYGFNRLLPHIDFRAIAKRLHETGTKVVGHSDFTAFHLALLAASQGTPYSGVSYAGPMLGYDFGAEIPSAFTQQHFELAMDGEPYSIKVDAPSSAQSLIKQGSAAEGKVIEGTLWGGNLALVCSLLGTPYLPKVEQGILFLEDINEHPYRIERMLLQLHQAGVLAQQQAILLGDFSDYKLTPFDNGYDFDAMVDYLRGILPVPMLTRLPFGHCADKLTLGVGRQVAIQDSTDDYILMLR